MITQVCIALIIFLLMCVIQGKHLFTFKSLVALFFAVYFADNLLIVGTNNFRSLQLIPNHVWEGFLVCGWSGKLYSIIFAIALLYPCRKILTKDDVGITIHQIPGSVLPALMVVLALSAWALCIGISSPKGKPDLQTLLYLAIMPGLNEELIYRGYLLGILDKIMPAKSMFLKAPLDWGVILTSLLFGLLHGFWLDSNLKIQIDLIALQNSTISGLIFAWLRARTGSLLMPVLAHGMVDFFFFLPRML